MFQSMEKGVQTRFVDTSIGDSCAIIILVHWFQHRYIQKVTSKARTQSHTPSGRDDETNKHTTYQTPDYMYQATLEKSLFLSKILLIFRGSNSLISKPRGPDPPALDCVIVSEKDSSS